MSIDEATPEEWDEAFAGIKDVRFYDNRSPKEAPCVPDPVNKPDHYRVGEVEAIAYIEQQLGSGVRDYLLGNLHKYLHRHRFKGNALEDLKKAQWYLNKLIMEEEQGG